LPEIICFHEQLAAGGDPVLVILSPPVLFCHPCIFYTVYESISYFCYIFKMF
jgi:hypothetical protein